MHLCFPLISIDFLKTPWFWSLGFCLMTSLLKQKISSHLIFYKLPGSGLLGFVPRQAGDPVECQSVINPQDNVDPTYCKPWIETKKDLQRSTKVFKGLQRSSRQRRSHILQKLDLKPKKTFKCLLSCPVQDMFINMRHIFCSHLCMQVLAQGLF